MITTKPTDWRQHDTKEARDAFADAQARLDNLDFGEDGYTPEWAAEDQKVADRYDRLVLQPAHAEFEQQCDEDEFACRWPEPKDGSRVEWEREGIMYCARRMDEDTGQGVVRRTWCLYGEEQPWSWRDLVVRFQLDMGELGYLVEQSAVTP